MNVLALNHNTLRQLMLSLLISLSVISCVTINIYFPAAAAEKAAEKIVDGVLQNQAPVEENKEQSNDQSSNQSTSVPVRILVAVTNFLIPAAEAAQANINIDSPEIRAIRNRMESRQAKLRPYYQSGHVGFTNNGLIASVNNAGLSVKKKSTVKKLIDAENQDRSALYSAIARANGHPEWHKDIQKTFSKTWIKKISSGWMYQNASGKWVKK
jgi:uncharacterized protein YdbL (DUF1318 family)